MYLFGEVFERQMAVSADSCGERLEELRGGGDRGIFRVVRSSYEYKIHGSGIDSGRKKGKKPFYLHML